MTGLDFSLAFESAFPLSPVHGIVVSEAVELLLVFLMFVLTLATVYFIQRWIGDY